MKGAHMATGEQARSSLPAPYFAEPPDATDADGRPCFQVGADFNREIVLPGTNETFPDGAVGIRVDDDFWQIGALPYAAFKETSIEAIVARFWPEVTGATFKPDSGHPWWVERWKDG